MTINDLILIFYLRRTDNYVPADRPKRETTELRHGIQGTRTAWSSIKLKQATDDLELKVIGTIDPVYAYNGDDPDGWEYRDGNGNPITTRAYYGWMSGVVVEYNGVPVKVTSGCSDEDGAWLASDEAADKITNNELYAVVRAMQITKDGSLRHPVLVRLREDI